MTFSLTGFNSYFARAVKRYLTQKPVLRAIRHSELSIICSADDDARPNAWLLDLSLQAIQDARQTSLKDLAERNKLRPDSVYYDVYPGNHYRLLQVLAHNVAQRNIIEVGTFTGMSSACMLRGMPESCKLTTFDLVSWRNFRSHLTEEDFASARITQVLEDLSDSTTFGKHLQLFNDSELIFCDAPKDGIFEHKFLMNLTRIKPTSTCLLVLDDIRLINMIDVWRAIKSPKLDLTSFGHWAGTGLVDITEGLKFQL
jgi:predicted O-methyltransferase YrrM